ncbi:unnamed protein product, partial [Amoebophrya sp. A25]
REEQRLKKTKKKLKLAWAMHKARRQVFTEMMGGTGEGQPQEQNSTTSAKTKCEQEGEADGNNHEDRMNSYIGKPPPKIPKTTEQLKSITPTLVHWTNVMTNRNKAVLEQTTSTGTTTSGVLGDSWGDTSSSASGTAKDSTAASKKSIQTGIHYSQRGICFSDPSQSRRASTTFTTNGVVADQQ